MRTLLLVIPLVACGGSKATHSSPSNQGGATADAPPSSEQLVALVRASRANVTGCVDASRVQPLGARFAELAAAEKQNANGSYVEHGECSTASAPTDLWQARAKPTEGAMWACTVWATPKPAAETGGEGEEGEDLGFSVSFSLDAQGALQPASLGCI